MAGTLGSNNDFPSLLLTEQGSAPTTPAASHQRLYIRTSDHTLVTVNSSGTVAAVGAAAAFIGCSVYNSATQSVSNTTDTKMLFNTELFDTSSFHDTVTNNSRITIPTGLGGYYEFGAMVVYAAGTSGIRSVRLMKNGATIRGSGNATTTAISQTVETTVIVSLVQTDYVEVNFFQNSGGALSTGDGSNDFNQNAFWCKYLGA